MSGFFKIERDFLGSPFWLSEEFTKPQAWIDLIGLANYADKTKYYKGAFQKVKRGQIVTSQQALANRWKWSRHRVSDFLRTLEAAEMVTTERTTNGTLLTVVNYGFYQSDGSAKGPRTGQRKDAGGTFDGHRRDIQEESKERKEIKKGYTTPPTRADVAAYIEEKGLQVDPDRFMDYYEAIGWEINGRPIKDWRAACRRWSGTKDYGKEEPKSFDDVMEEARKLTPEDLYGPTWNGGQTS